MAVVLPFQYNGFEADQQQQHDDEDSGSCSSSGPLVMMEETPSTAPQTVVHDDDEPMDMNTSSRHTPLLVTNIENSTSFLKELDVEEVPENYPHTLGYDYVMVPSHASEEDEQEESQVNDDALNTTLETQVDDDDEDEEDEQEITAESMDLAMEEEFSAESQEEEELESTSPPPLFLPAIPDEPRKYGGLANLGNTCYMASALQMLASVDGFVQDLQNRVPPPTGPKKNDDSNVKAEEEEEKVEEEYILMDTDASSSSATKFERRVRDALLELLGGLANGETVRPDDFKRCIDEHSGLFLGYRQQDSHEFLTTLLDLIDEEYKKKDDDEKKKEGEGKSEDDDDMERSTSSNQDEDETKEKEGSDENVSDASKDQEKTESSDISETDMVDRSPLKRPRVDEEEDATVASERVETQTDTVEDQAVIEDDDDASRVTRSSSFINLGYGDIEELLYWKNEEHDDVETPKSNHETKEEEPKYKLVGGRMNTSQAELTRYDQSQDNDSETAGASTSTNDKLQDMNDIESENGTVIPSPVDSNFTTEVCVSLTCESCKYRRSHNESYLHLSLEIGSSSCSNIDDCVRKFFAPEKREIKCEKCFHNSAVQTTEITKLPKALLFHLKRFIVDISPDYTSISYRKDQSAVSFEEQIPLENNGDGLFEEFMAPNVALQKGFSYAIRSVVNHIGSSASCGHYTADAKRLYDDEMGDGETREWTRFNDCYVSKVSSREAVTNASQTAYMIMYELEEGLTV